MFKKIIFVLMCATAASSCLKEVSNYNKKLFLDDVDAQGIKLFMLSHKVVEGEDGPELALTTENDPENMWNTRFTQEITENTNYDDLVGHAFMDTSILKVVVAPGDTIDTRTGRWIYINKRGAKAEYAKDSASVLVQYIGTFLNDKQFALSTGKTIQLVAGGADYGLMVGIKYLEPGRLEKTWVVPEPDEDGNQADPYWKMEWVDSGQGWVIIPSQLGKGGVLSSDVPPNSVLVYNTFLQAIAYPITDGDKPETATHINTCKLETVWFDLSRLDKAIGPLPSL